MTMKSFCVALLALLALLVSGGVARSGDVADLTSFSAGTPALAAEVNGNFDKVAAAVNDNDERIAALEARIDALEVQLLNVLAINDYVSLENVNGAPAVRISGANLQVVNGLGLTRSSNGTGNVLIGYDELRMDGETVPQCSLGSDPQTLLPVTDENECLTVGGVMALNHKSGSHFLVVGVGNNYTRWGGFVAGRLNTANYDFATVTGGQSNTASGSHASVMGGSMNVASGSRASVGGGSFNVASGSRASVTGGGGNLASGGRASINGGMSGIASGSAATVNGGFLNEAAGLEGATVNGGERNEAHGKRSVVSGGLENVASGDYAVVGGGASRQASGESDWVAGALLEDD